MAKYIYTFKKYIYNIYIAKFIYIYIALKLKIKEFIIIIIIFFLSRDSYYTADLGSYYFLKYETSSILDGKELYTAFKL